MIHGQRNVKNFTIFETPLVRVFFKYWFTFQAQVVVVQEQPENVECSNYFGSLLTNDAKCTREIKCSVITEKSHVQQEEDFSPPKWNYV
jgi:hypothetical protein